MRVLLTSDLHYRLRQYDWLMAAAPNFDAVVIAGDHLDIASAVPPQAQIAALCASLARLARNARLFVASGNHDLNARSAEGEKTADWLDVIRSPMLAVDGDSADIGDTTFTVCPWWDGPHAQDAIERMLDVVGQRRRARWLWVYHAPPESALSWTGKRHFGDAFLKKLVQRHSPTAVMCGHIHEAPFKQGGSWIDRDGATWLFNAGRQIGDVPARIEIDFTASTARWISLAGIEERALQ